DRITLTGRERDVLNALDRGLSNREISEELFLSPTTIKTHLARLYGKLGVSSRTAALARAREEGLLD
ncbi:MAG: LuxR C-terminal-related transcriptional regulator, partial [Dermabacter sp.]|nr:LuxR C-terminal-related transcriptional regulator [Dermabacter sp.]